MCGIALKFVVYIINLGMLLCGIGVGVVGALLHFTEGLAEKAIQPLLSQLQSFIKIDDTSALVKEVLPLLKMISIALMALGIVITIIAGLAFLGLCCLPGVFLSFYVIIVACLAVAQIAIGVFYLYDVTVIEEYTHQGLQQLIQNFKGYPSTETSTLLLQVFHTQLKCCGATNGSDFDTIAWNKNLYPIELKYPPSCCTAFGGETDSTGMDTTACPLSFTTENSFYHVGCTKTLTTYFSDNGGRYAAFGFLGLACLEIALIVMITLSLILPV